MKRFLFLLAGIGLFYSVYASTDDGAGGAYSNPGTLTNPGTSITIHPGTNHSPLMTIDPTSNDDGLGNAGNTQGVGTDQGGDHDPSVPW